MSDMFALGAARNDQLTPVSISEDSETFQNLLSFIYPDKTSTIFTSPDVLLPVLSAAGKYQMKAVLDALQTQIMSKSISGKSCREALLYIDPLTFYVKAKEFNLDDLANAAANATLNINLGAVPDARSDLARVPAIWFWQLLNLRTGRSAWLLQKCGSEFAIANSKYTSHIKYGSLYVPQACKCGQGPNQTSRGIPASLLDMVKANPCARAIRKIDFISVLQCLRCGTAASVHFSALCDEYEKEFGTF